LFKISLSLCLALLSSSCAIKREQLGWRVRDMVLRQTALVNLRDPQENIVLTLPTKTLQQIMLAHLRIARSANVQTELFVVEGEEPNAFAGLHAGQKIIGINVGMLKLLGDDIDAYAALLGHEAAHWAKGHIDAGQLRSSTLNALGTLVGAGLGAAGVPAGGLIAGLGVDLIDASFSRDQEREADAHGVEYMWANGYEPRAAIKLQEKLLGLGSGFRLPFLSSHPSGDERIANLKALIDAKLGQSRPPAVAEESRFESPVRP
jgi:predicted Zn-dependent protease